MVMMVMMRGGEEGGLVLVDDQSAGAGPPSHRPPKLEASAACRRPLRAEDPRPSVLLERHHDAADGRQARPVTPTGGVRPWWLIFFSSGDLHYIYVARRRRLSLDERRSRA